MVQPGQILAGKFQVERVLGEGGMGVVVSAQHLQLGQRVALKFLLREAMSNPQVAERFMREARATVKLKSEHVGRVIDVGQLEDGAPYIVMEYLDGCDLQQFLLQHTKLPTMQAVDFVLQAGEAVAEAHSLGIIHRDLKPANLFLTVRPDGGALVKVLDFGISKATNAAEDFSLTRTATVMGSPGYMSPEQLRSAKDVDARTDVWALGVILFELVCGYAPFGGETITELTLKVAMDPVPPLDPSAPPGFAEVVNKCLAKDMTQRYGSVAELAAALVPFGPPDANRQAQRIARVQAGVATSVQRSAVFQATAGTPTTLSASAVVAPEPAKPRARLGVVIGAAAVAAAVIIGVILLASGGGKAPSAAKTAPPIGTEATPPTVTPPPPPPGVGTAAAGTGTAAPSVGTAAPTGSGTGTAAATGSGSGTDGASAGTGSAMTATGSGSGSAPTAGSGSGSSRRHGKRTGSGSGSGETDFSGSRH